ncbi:hypothetical protein ACIHQR_23815 [Corallococcus coralloides]|uniref:hypothetical protein n=1 Tax=Corallococcus coralloides TaxID=184914 RepID=UPI00384F46B0
MGKKADAARKATKRSIRATPLSSAEKARLRKTASYEGSPYHKRKPGDFGLTPPAAPRRDKTLCDEAQISKKAQAIALFKQAIEKGLVSTEMASGHFPKQLWVVDETGRAFEAIYGGSKTGCYHGYPIRKQDPFSKEIIARWKTLP